MEYNQSFKCRPILITDSEPNLWAELTNEAKTVATKHHLSISDTISLPLTHTTPHMWALVSLLTTLQ